MWNYNVIVFIYVTQQNYHFADSVKKIKWFDLVSAQLLPPRGWNIDWTYNINWIKVNIASLDENNYCTR